MTRRPGQGFIVVAARVEAVLLRVLIVVLLLLVTGQGLLAYEPMQPFFSYVYRLEGTTYEPPDPFLPEVSGAAYLSSADHEVLVVSLALINATTAPEAQLLVDGHVVADFTNPRVTIEVYEGNSLEIDARGITEELRFRVVDVAPRLASPTEGQEIIVQDARVPVATINTR